MLRKGCQQNCPGCAHRALSAHASENQKRQWLKKTLAPWQDKIADLLAVKDDSRWNYREKIRLTTQWSESMGWRFGLMRRDELVAIPNCPIHSIRSGAVIELLSRVLPAHEAFPMAFYIQSGAQTTLVLKTQQLPDLAWLTDRVKQSLQQTGLEGLWLHLHPAAGRRMFAKKGWHLLYGQVHSFDNNGLQYGPTAFQQLIPQLYEHSVAAAKHFLAPTADDLIIDLYCGNGYTLKQWRQAGAHTIGVELNGEAVTAANINAPDATVLRGKCEHRIAQLKLYPKPPGQHLLYVNPPRTGLEPQILQWIADDFKPTRIAYLSCSAGTLRRDLEALVKAAYQIERIIPYDFFPQTYHVETLALIKHSEY